MAGTGAAHDAAEISFDLPDDSESSAEVAEPTPQPEEKVAPAEAVPERTESKPKSQSQPMVAAVTSDENERTKTLDTNASAQEQRREWAIPKAIESEAAGVEQAVVTHDKQAKLKEAPMGARMLHLTLMPMVMVVRNQLTYRSYQILRGAC